MVAISQPVAITTITGHGSSSAAGRAGGWGSGASLVSSVIGDQRIGWDGDSLVLVLALYSLGLSTISDVKDPEARLANDLALAVVRLARQLRTRRAESPVSLTQFSALATLAKEGAMTPGALAVRERVRPPSMTRVIASLAELGLVARAAHPVDGRQVVVSASPAGMTLVEAERKASQEWLKAQLSRLDPDERQTLVTATDLMSAMVFEGA
ncbi:hypothetical protein MBOE_22500 [Mycolicibacterium boenickei]|uniref:HTH marR-type domain-containing protein n=1 Tax=Mycolicibacterium boenickei TaxID=146017 RepID=A0ABM7IUT2_9MYCO|nr:hypothetical protein MBOE_22500 [Mycolicibacterium boenickei]